MDELLVNPPGGPQDDLDPAAFEAETTAPRLVSSGAGLVTVALLGLAAWLILRN